MNGHEESYSRKRAVHTKLRHLRFFSSNLKTNYAIHYFTKLQATKNKNKTQKIKKKNS